jgi:nicotinamide riboside transporter PnuC
MLKSKDSLNPLIVIIDNIKHSGTMLSNILLYRKIEQKWINWIANQFMAVKTHFCAQKSSTELSRHKPYRQSISNC